MLASELIIRNNKELIRGVNRVLDVTVSALEIGVAVAMALANQKIVIEKVEAVNKTTSDIISGTAARLKTQGAAIQKQASSAMLDIEALKIRVCRHKSRFRRYHRLPPDSPSEDGGTDPDNGPPYRRL